MSNAFHAAAPCPSLLRSYLEGGDDSVEGFCREAAYYRGLDKATGDPAALRREAEGRCTWQRHW